MKNSYIIISPCKNEEKNITEVISSVLNQTIKPKLWVIVNDGSTDNSLKIIKKFAKKNKWIKYISLDNNKRDLNFRYSFVCNTGFKYILDYCKEKKIEYNYISLLDTDIILDKKYFESLINLMKKDNKLGIVSGGIYTKYNNKLQYEYRNKDNPSGA
ncbi:MAG: glycosyltransferase family 2 protein, partial [Candidatus Woesearchaeota archaeon]